MGLGVVLCFMVKDDLAAGRLVHVLGRFNFVRIAIRALYAPSKLLPDNEAEVLGPQRVITTLPKCWPLFR